MYSSCGSDLLRMSLASVERPIRLHLRSGQAGSVTTSTAAQQAPVAFEAFTNILLS